MTILGTVAPRDFDMGCILTIGATLVYYPVDGSTRAAYVLDIPAINSEMERYGNKIPVFFDSPSDPYSDFVIPSLVFKSPSFTPAPERMPHCGLVAVAPAIGQDPITIGGVTGYARNELQVRADCYDMAFDLNVYTRRRQELNYLKLALMKIMKIPMFNFEVVDSLGDVRYYDAKEISWANTAELADIADRSTSETVSFTVEGEIDVFDPIEMPTVQDVRINFSAINR
jgi:hypothetical protein